MNKLISKLKEKQLFLGFNDEKMGKLLGCSRQTYNNTKLGIKPPGIKILKGISIAFPDLERDIKIFLSSDANKLPKDASENPIKQPSEAQESGLKRFFGELLWRIKKGMF